MFHPTKKWLLIAILLLVSCKSGDSNDDSKNDPADNDANPTATATVESESPPDDVSVPEAVEETVWIVSAEQPIDVYSCPETTCDTVGTLMTGMTLNVLSTEDDWHEIELEDGTIAYIEVSFTEQVTRLRPPEDSSLPPGVTPSDSTSEALEPPPLSAPPGQPTFGGTIASPQSDGPPSDLSAPPGQPTVNGTTTSNNNDGPPNVTSQPPPGAN